MRDGPRALEGVAMGQAVWRAAPVFYLPDWRSEVAREIFLGHILGRRTGEVRVGNVFNCQCIHPNLVTQTHLATRGYGKAHKENLCHMIPF